MHTHLKKSLLTEALFFFTLAACLFFYCTKYYLADTNREISQSPYLFPSIIAIFLFLLSICLFVQAAKAGYDGIKFTPQKKTGILMLSIFSFIYYIFLSWKPLPQITFSFPSFSLMVANFEIATIGYLFCLLFLMGVRKKAILTLVPVFVSLFLCITFRTMLHVMLP